MKQYNLYILLSDTGSFISKGIKLYTKEPYSHVSLALDIDLNEIYSFGRLKMHNPLIGGFVREDKDYGTYSIFPNTTIELYSIKVNEQQFLQIKNEIERFSNSKRKYSYNFLGVAGVLVNRPINREYSYFCSQFVAEVLQNSDINIIDKDAGLTLPNDFRNNDNLNLIYSGHLKGYQRQEAYFNLKLLEKYSQ